MKPESFGEYIRELRKQKNLSLRIVSSEINIDQSTLSKIERNEKLAPQYIVKPLATLYNEDYRIFQTRYLSEKIYREIKEFDFAFEAIEITTKRLRLEKKGTQSNNKRTQLIEKIKSYLVNSPIEKAWLFGSFARDEAKFNSDIDLLIQLEQSASIDLLDFIGITYDLEDLLGRNVDVVQEGTLKDNVEQIVENEKVLIYEK
jgi:predicted nucleotidyltransferase